MADGNLFTIISALAGSIGQNIFLNILSRGVSEDLPTLNSTDVISAGAANLHKLAPTTEILHVLRKDYAAAVHDILIYALVTACMALIFTFGMKWRNLKVVAEQGEVSNSPTEDGNVEKL